MRNNEPGDYIPAPSREVLDRYRSFSERIDWFFRKEHRTLLEELKEKIEQDPVLSPQYKDGLLGRIQHIFQKWIERDMRAEESLKRGE